jgi:hypothetical protein
MAFLHNIKTVAHYEAKTLRRSWFFRLFAIGALFIFTIMNIGVFSPIGDEDWESVGIASALPHINLYLLNLAQAIVVIFLAADFLKRDKKLDTNEVLYTRSMSNMEYVVGKTWGILKLFLGLNIIILGIGLIINIISPAMKVDVVSYISHLLLISVPTLVFSLGFAYVIMSLIRNQAITFLILLGYAALNIFYLFFRSGYIFDYMAFGLPMFRSGIIGYDNFTYILFQRLIYFSLGIASVMATVVMFKRLPQSAIQGTIAKALMILFLIVAGFSALKVTGSYRHDRNDKLLTIETNSKYEKTLFATVSAADLNVTHNGESIEVTATMSLKNDHPAPLQTLTLSLNPSLEVTGVESEGAALNFTRDFNILSITPAQPIASGGETEIKIRYAGGINESFCYPYYLDDIKKYPYRIAMVNINKRQAFLSDDYVLLTPETHWYPVAALNYYPSNPARIKVDFTRYTLKVNPGNNLIPVSQGQMVREGDAYLFTNNTPLTGLTLALGDYVTESITADDIQFNVHHFPGHDYYKAALSELADTLPLLVASLMTDLENSFTTQYPFSTLSLLEVPVQFFSYPRKNTQTRAEVQPAMVLLPEKLTTLSQSGFARDFKRQKRRMEKSNQVITDKELQVRLFMNFARNTFISGTSFRFVAGAAVNEPVRYLLGPSFYFFKNNFYSDEFPVINSVFESHLQKVTTAQRGVQAAMGGLSENDKANLLLREKSLKEILNMSPGDDTVRSVLTVKGDYLFNMMRSKAGIEPFKKWFAGYLNQNMFTRVDMNRFDADLMAEFGFSLSEYLPDWFDGNKIPGFIFSDVKVTEIVVDERSRFQITFTVSNPEDAPGLFNISFRTGGPGGGGGRGGGMAGVAISAGGGGGAQRIEIAMQGRGMEAADVSKIVFMEPNQAKRVGIILDNQPRAMLINTLMSRNIPGELTYPISIVEKAARGVKPFEGEEVLSSLPLLLEANELVVDNEDPGFSGGQTTEQSPLKKLLGIKNTSGETYSQIRPFMVPEFWQPVVQSDYYGLYVKSAVYTRAGSGDRTVSWRGVIDSPGYYDVYAYIPKSPNRMMMAFRQGGGPGGGGGGEMPAGQPGVPGAQQGQAQMKEFQFFVYHDDGTEEVMLDYETADPGWNKLGSYYLSPDTVMVALSNKSTARMVVGDAVKWVKRNN